MLVRTSAMGRLREDDSDEFLTEYYACIGVLGRELSQARARRAVYAQDMPDESSKGTSSMMQNYASRTVLEDAFVCQNPAPAAECGCVWW